MPYAILDVPTGNNSNSNSSNSNALSTPLRPQTQPSELQKLRKSQAVDALPAPPTCTPSVNGWEVVRGAALRDVGYYAAALPLGRHLLVIGGVDKVPRSIDVYNYTLHYTQRGINLFDPRNGVVSVAEEVVANGSGNSVDCPRRFNATDFLHSLQQQQQRGREEDSPYAGYSCLEVRHENNNNNSSSTSNITTAAVLPVPVVGSGSVVRVRNRVYALGACNTIPPEVRLDLLRHVKREGDRASVRHASAWWSSPEVQLVERYLRSVMRLRFYQRGGGGRRQRQPQQQAAAADAHVLSHEVTYLPPTMTLRFNATCVAGAEGVVYIVGGVDAYTGESLSSVAQYDTASQSFVEGVWTLDEPVITPAAASDNGLLFLAGGHRTQADPSLFNPTRQRRVLHTHFGVYDKLRSVFDRHVVDYATDATAAKLQWTSPQLLVHGSAVFMLGSGGAAPYGGVAYWANLSTSLPPPSRTSREEEAERMEPADSPFAETATPLREAQHGVEVGTQTDEAGPASRRRDNTSSSRAERGVMSFVDFAFVPERRDAVVAAWPSADGASFEFFLFGGRGLAAASQSPFHQSSVAASDIFKATFHFCTDGDDLDDAALRQTARRASSAPTVVNNKKIKQVAHVLPRLLGFSYTRVMTSSSAEQTGAAAGGPAASTREEASVPNNRGLSCVTVDGYTPLWYNISFSVLLSFAETQRACPGITNHTHAPAFSSCSLMLSTSPRCDEPVVEFRHLSPANVQTALIAAPEARKGYVGSRLTQALAVGQTLLVGSLDRGLVQAMATGEEGRSASDINSSDDDDDDDRESVYRRFSRKSTGEKEVEQGAAVRNAPRVWPSTLNPSRSNTTARSRITVIQSEDAAAKPVLFYEQSFLYVCFSQRRSAVASCGFAHRQRRPQQQQQQEQLSDASPQPRDRWTVSRRNNRNNSSNANESLSPRSTRFGSAAVCRSRFYETLAAAYPLVLSPEIPCDQDSDPSSSSAPAQPNDSKHLFKSWLLLTILIVLLVVIFIFWLVTFVLMPGYAFARSRRPHAALHEVAVTGGASPDQQRSLLPYREACIFLGAGGGFGGDGGGGVGVVGNGGTGPYGLVYDDFPDEYEAALQAAGINPGPMSLKANWDSTDSAARQRRLLDGKYELIRKLGKGSFSVVYLVRRITDNAVYALKYLQCSDDADRHEALKECEVVYALQGHPNVIQLFDMFMSYRFDRRIVTVPQTRKTRAAAMAATTGGRNRKKGHKKESEGKPLPHKDEDGRARWTDEMTHPLSPTVKDEAAGGDGAAAAAAAWREPTTPAESAEENGGESRVNQYSSSVLLDGKDSGRRNSISNGGAGAMITTAAAISKQQSTRTASSSNNTSAAISPASRPIVHVDSNYFDAMTVGALRDDSLESPTASLPQQQQQQQQQQEDHLTRVGQGDDKQTERDTDGEGGGVGAVYPRHPHHQRKISSLQAERYLSIVMAYHERGDLARWVRQRRALQPFIPEATIVSIAFQVLSLLSFMHHRHQPPIIHRDLKPENILLTTHVHYENVSEDFLPIVVTDFGLSRVMDKTFCETGVGSLPYVAPECWQRRYSTKVDIWALGCVLYAVCSKRVDNNNVKVMFSECAQPDFHAQLRHELEHVYGYSDALAWFITRLLAVKPDDRPTAGEALRMLRHQPTDENGVPLFDGPTLAALLRATPVATQKQAPQSQQDLHADSDPGGHHSSNHPSKSSGGEEDHCLSSRGPAPSASGHVMQRKRPTPLPVMRMSERQSFLTSITTPSTSETSTTTPVEFQQAAGEADGKEAAVSPASSVPSPPRQQRQRSVADCTPQPKPPNGFREDVKSLVPPGPGVQDAAEATAPAAAASSMTGGVPSSGQLVVATSSSLSGATVDAGVQHEAAT